MSDFVSIVRAAIAAKNIKKKSLAEKYGLFPSDFSLMLQGQKRIPYEIMEQLIDDLELERLLKKAG